MNKTIVNYDTNISHSDSATQTRSHECLLEEGTESPYKKGNF